jgi:hypothetical protein
MAIEDILRRVLSAFTRKFESGNADLAEVTDVIANAIFSRPKGRFFFLFTQNFRRTNIQVAELISLITQHSKTESKELLPKISPSYIDFTTFQSVKAHIRSLVENTEITDKTTHEKIISELKVFTSNKIILEIHYGSCSAFFPPHIVPDIMRICGESGYIHSCGPLLLLRNATKVTEKDFLRAMQLAKAITPPSSKFMLIPYCHEDFTKTDRNRSPFLKYGLDDVKIHLAKAYVGGSTLISVLEKIARKYNRDVLLAPAGEYSHVPPMFDGEFDGAKRNTVWVISDSDWVPGSHFPGERKFYVIYLQAYSTVNILHNFEENKPGWASHTTLPHSLTGAMINLGRPWAPNPDAISLLDPFGGSGTTLLEASKLSTVNAYASDAAPIYKYVTKANIQFFSLSPRELDDLIAKLRRYAALPALGIVKPRKLPLRGDRRWVELALQTAEKWARETGDDYLNVDPKALTRTFAQFGDPLDRQILFYTALKAIGRGRGEIERGSKHVMDAFKAEMDEVIASAERFRRALALPNCEEDGVSSSDFLLDVVDGDYSPAVRTSVGRADPLPLENNSRYRRPKQSYLMSRFWTHRVGDVTIPIETHGPPRPSYYDIIVTDPPYGFNTEEDYWETARDIRNWLKELIERLNPSGGQLVMACPDVTFSGRSVAPFVRATFLAREIVRISAELKRECLRPALNLPPMGVMGPPYYWIAEKTLRRRILHFWIRSIPDSM